MGGGDVPYLYQKPTAYSVVSSTDRGFNPKAATQASWSPRPARPKPDGPLIDSKEMNRHPDSYFIVPYGNLDWKPMSARTNTKVRWTRYFQLFLRICALFGAAGLLVCVICIKPTGQSTDWIIRIPPGIAILHVTYAIYHLSRSSKGRTPASSASYHIFASIMDACIIPFLAFTALMAWKQHIEPLDVEEEVPGQWSSLFESVPATETVVWSTYLIAVTTAGIHAASLIISIYLALVFRKISKLPPDMNPLEDNLTKRSHKRNKSSMSFSASSLSQTHLSAPLMDSPSNRAVPFMHTRNESDSSLPSSPSPQRRSRHARNDSRTELPSQAIYQPISQCSSRNDLRRSPDRNTPKRSSGLRDSATVPSTPPRSRPVSAHASPSHQLQASLTKHALQKEPEGENWFVHAASPPSTTGFDLHDDNPPFDEAPPEFAHLRLASSRTPVVAQPAIPGLQSEHGVISDVGTRVSDAGTARQSSPQGPAPGYRYDFTRTPKPLEMNPPTPDPKPSTSADKFLAHRARFEQRALQERGSNAPSATSGHNRTESTPDRVAAPLNNDSPATWEETSFNPRKSFQEDNTKAEGYGVAAKGKNRFYGNLKDSLRAGKRGSRVVSSGIDVDEGRKGLRGREVSGKVAEEGRAW